MAKLSFVLLLFVVVTRAENHLEQSLNSLISHIESNNVGLYRSAIIHDDDYDKSIVNEVTKAVRSRLPGKNYNWKRMEKVKMEKLSPSTFYLVISSNTLKLKSTLAGLHENTWSTTRRQFLIVSDTINPKEILEYAWSKSFLEVTLLRPSSAIIYGFNPFIGKIEKFKFNSKSILFPAKVADLHDYKVHVDAVDDQPFCNVERNTSGYIVNRSGAENKVFDLIAQKLNFQPQFIPRIEKNSYEEDYRHAGFLREVNSKKLLENIFLGKAEMVANARVCPYKYAIDLNYTCSDNDVFTSSTCPLVPVIRTKAAIDLDFFIAFGCIVCLIFFVFLLAHCCGFDRHFWNFFIVIKLILGLTHHNQPHKMAEKIFYACLIVASTTYLANIFDHLTKLKLNEFEEVNLATIDDIKNRRLALQGDYEVIPKYMQLSNNHEFGIQAWNSRFSCVITMLKYQNVTCLMSEIIGQLTINAFDKKNDKPTMKMLKDCPWYGSSKMIMARGSPYGRQINQILSKLQAGGITNWLIKHDLHNINLKNNMIRENYEMKTEKFDLIIWAKISFAGLLIAMIVFLFEFILAHYRLRILFPYLKNLF